MWDFKTNPVRFREIAALTRDMYDLPFEITQRTKKPNEIRRWQCFVVSFN